MKKYQLAIGKDQIKDSWYWDEEDVEEELVEARKVVNAIMKKKRLMNKERKEQPPLLIKSYLCGTIYYTNRYHLITGADGAMIMIMESKTKATEEEIKIYKEMKEK